MRVAPASPPTPAELRELALTALEYQALMEQLGRVPNRLELGMLGALWSEHCSYKTSKALLRQLPSAGERVVQGPGENAGVVDLGDDLLCCFKIESHNHPSAIEPVQGAATGVGGILRDVFAMGARPVALLDGIRFGDLDDPRQRHRFARVVEGIGWYGNCIGVPTVGGETYFDDAYQHNCLVNAMCVGLARRDQLVPAPVARAIPCCWWVPTPAGMGSMGRRSPRCSWMRPPRGAGPRCRWATPSWRSASWRPAWN